MEENVFNLEKFKRANDLNAEAIKAAGKGDWELAFASQSDARTIALDALFGSSHVWSLAYRDLKSRGLYTASGPQAHLNLAAALESAADYLKKMSEWNWLRFELERDAAAALQRATALESKRA